MDWTNDSTLDFLEAYRDESVLWDRNDEYHKDKVRTNEAWCRLSKRFGPSVGDLKRKKDSLMATYRSHLRKKKASIRSGAVGVDVYQPVWFAFDFMENFLSPVYDYNSEACSVGEDDPAEDPMVEVTMDESALTAQHKPRHVQLRRSRTPAYLPEGSTHDHLQRLDLVTTDASEVGPDECDLYGMLLAKRMRKMPEEERILAMYEIDGLLIRRKQTGSTVPPRV